VATNYGHGVSCERIEAIEAVHPVPDEASDRAAKRTLDMVMTGPTRTNVNDFRAILGK